MGADPADLPRFPGSRMERDRRGRSGDLATLELEYRTTARLDRVRRHYRAMLRRHDWVVGDVEFHGDTWDIEANRGTREAWIELKGDDDGTEVRIEVSWPAGDDPSGRGGPDGRGGSGGRGGNDDRSGPGG